MNNLSARPHQEAVPYDGVDNVHRATTTPRSVILVGAGRRGLGAHVPALADYGYFSLTGIIDTKERIAELSGIPVLDIPMYDSLDPVLAGPRPDLAIVATPHDSHVRLAEDLLRARVPTLLEKPPARSAGELATLLELSRNLRTPLATSLPLHYQARCQPFIHLLRSPELTDAEVNIAASVPGRQGADSWRLSRERAGGGVLIDLGYHYLELLIAYLGAPADMSVLLTHAAGNHSEVESEALVSLWFPDRRLHVQLWLRAWPDSTRDSELSIKRAGVLVHHAAADRPAEAALPRGGLRPQLPTPTASQLQDLVTSGFLDGQGGWDQVLSRQHLVMQLIDDLYANAHRIACPPGTAGQPDVACPVDLTGLPERTLV